MKLKQVEVVVSLPFKLNEFGSQIPCLNTVKIGVRSWTSLFKGQDQSYGLLLETYYVTYPEFNGNPNTSSLFRVGQIREARVFELQAKTVGEKIFLQNPESFKEIEFLRQKNQTKNELVFLLEGRSQVLKIFFYEKEKSDCPLRVFVDNEELEKEVQLSAVEKLSKLDKRRYLFVDEVSTGNLIIETPTYSIAKGVKGSSILLLLKLFIQEGTKLLEVQSIILVYDLSKEEKEFKFPSLPRFIIYLKHSVEGEKLTFNVYKIFNQNTNKWIEVREEKNKSMREELVVDSLSGAIFYDPTSSVVLPIPEPELKPLNSETSSKKKKFVVCMSIVLSLFSAFFVFIWLYFHFNKTVSKKRRVKRNVK